MHASCAKSQEQLPQWLWSCCSTAGSFHAASMQSSTLPTQPWIEVGVQQIDPAKALAQAQQPNQTAQMCAKQH